ncbi:quinone oxidoreductase 1 [Roseovarius sp. A-2]|uniref:NAD(P)H-quinone oxidoreductase n=1 Tax=Roseovarius sp. A-2 TaxID=1570360 RepID=UPI0009B50348|nr:NAD(P)H-quinone oxidoreductase [Roseovarius sp. A-2]GAW33526.1 quinone oxidoreductase 1 [Roseovarius sp. A-2]
MTQTTRAVIAKGAGGPEVLEVTEAPLAQPGPRELLVRVRAAGVNRPDVMQRQGNYPPPPGASEVLGLELAGEVEAVGLEVQHFAVGSRVMGLVASGAYADRAILPEQTAIAVPDDLSMVEAGAVPETFFTVWSNVFERAKLQSGETILIHGGTSGIGTTATMLAKTIGANVIVTAGSDEKCKACLKLGADHAINYKSDDFVTAARDLTGGRGPDVVLDMVGADYFQRNLEVVAEDGRISQIAFQTGSRTDLDLGPLLFKRLTMTGSTLRARPIEMKERLAQAVEKHVGPLLASGAVRPLIDSTFALEDVAKAHARMDSSQHIGKIVLTTD